MQNMVTLEKPRPARSLSKQLKEAVPEHIRRRAKIRRALMAEAMGCRRYSRPALNHLDDKLSKYVSFPGGVFLEIGANDGYSQSNTYALERWLDWSGILIEPLPELFSVCQGIRPASLCYNLACTASIDERFLTISPSNLTTSVGRHPRAATSRDFRVPTSTLSEVIDDANMGVPDFISIDVEHFELEVIKGLRLDEHAPLFMLVETDSPDDVKALLEKHMTLEDQLSYHDYMFQRIIS